MKPIVVDASIALSFCLEDERNEEATALLADIGHYKIIGPPHWWAEITNGLLMAEKRKRINSHEINEAMKLLMALEIEIIPATTVEFAEKIIPLALSHKLTSYDACYLHLTITKKAPLATLDKALKTAASKAGAAIFK